MSVEGISAALAIAQHTVDAALRAGASQAEATVSIGDRFSAEARGNVVTKLEQSRSRSLHVRVFVDGRKALLSTTDLERAGIDAAARAVVEQARCVAEDPYTGLPDLSTADPMTGFDLELFSEDIAQRDAESKLQEALALERGIRQCDSRVTNSNGSHVGDTVATTALANSNGFAGAYRSTRAHRSSSPVAADGSTKRTSSYGTAARRLVEMEAIADVASKAVERTVSFFGARKPRTTRIPVIFERDVASSVLADLFAALSASNAAVGNSWLSGRVGERIGSELVTIVDDGTLPGHLGSSPFDGEGVPTRRTVAFENGTLRTLLYDTYYARKLGAATTGNSGGGAIAPNNFYLEAGGLAFADLIAQTPRAILVMETIGFATEHASGTYSRGARGFAIEDGAIAYPVEEFTIASTFGEMLAGIDAVANDLRFDASVVSPSFRIAEMTISGE